MRTLNQGLDTKHGLITPPTLESTAMGKSKERELLNGLMAPYMRVTSKTTIFMAKAPTNGMMAAHTLANGI